MSDSRLPKNLAQSKERAEDEMGQFLAYLMAAIANMTELNETLTDEQKALAEKVNNNLSSLNERSKYLLKFLLDMNDVTWQVIYQRWTAKKAFMSGWKGFHGELMLHLSAEQKQELEPILLKIMANDWLF